MRITTAGLFTDSKAAGDAVAELKGAGYADDISVVAKDESTGKVSTEQVEQSVADGAAAGAVTGGMAGILTGVLASLVSVALPGVGTVLVAGPFVTSWALAGGALGALTGGIVGALVDAGFDENKAKMYEESILRGEVLIAVTSDPDAQPAIVDILQKYGVYEVDTVEIEA